MANYAAEDIEKGKQLLRRARLAVALVEDTVNEAADKVIDFINKVEAEIDKVAAQQTPSAPEETGGTDEKVSLSNMYDYVVENTKSKTLKAEWARPGHKEKTLEEKPDVVSLAYYLLKNDKLFN